MTESRAITQIKYRVDTATQLVGTGVDGKAYEDLELAIKALEAVGKIAEIIKFEQQATSCEHTKLKSFEMIENIISDYQLNS